MDPHKKEAQKLQRLVNRAFDDWVRFMNRVSKRKGMDSERFGQFVTKTEEEIKKYHEDESTFFCG
jgi:hypothetical protein